MEGKSLVVRSRGFKGISICMEKDLWLARVPFTPEMPHAIPSPLRRSTQAVGAHTLQPCSKYSYYCPAGTTESWLGLGGPQNKEDRQPITESYRGFSFSTQNTKKVDFQTHSSLCGDMERMSLAKRLENTFSLLAGKGNHQIPTESTAQ